MDRDIINTKGNSMFLDDLQPAEAGAAEAPAEEVATPAPTPEPEADPVE